MTKRGGVFNFKKNRDVTYGQTFFEEERFVATLIFSVRLLHAVEFSYKLRWLAQINVNHFENANTL